MSGVVALRSSLHDESGPLVEVTPPCWDGNAITTGVTRCLVPWAVTRENLRVSEKIPLGICGHSANLRTEVPQMPIRDLARDEIVSVGPETPILDVARRMRDENVGSVVVTNDDVPTGIVTDRDLTTRVLAEAMEADGHTADDVMSTNVCAVGPDSGVYEALEAMSENGVRRLPICGENDEIEGIVTADDLLELLADESRQLASVIQTQRPGY